MLPLLVKDGLTTAFIGSSLLYIILSLSFYDLFDCNGWKRSAQKLMVRNNVMVWMALQYVILTVHNFSIFIQNQECMLPVLIYIHGEKFLLGTDTKMWQGKTW